MNPCSASTKTQLNFFDEEEELDLKMVLARAVLGILSNVISMCRTGVEHEALT
jgi:hypothetical protein